MHKWDDVVRHNTETKEGCWVVMDGMVFDIEAWLPEHPGGGTIIPEQALNKDCTVFFELCAAYLRIARMPLAPPCVHAFCKQTRESSTRAPTHRSIC